MTPQAQAFRTLITPADLLALRAGGNDDVVVLDCGFDLADVSAGERAFLAGHVPGALYAHLDRDLSGVKTGQNGRHPLPERSEFAVRVGAWGIGPLTQVVTYDAQGGPYAARAWWMLRWLGHDAVAVLDGGIKAWREAGGALATGEAAPSSPHPAYATGAMAAMPTLDADTLKDALERESVHLLDARAAERYRGEIEPIDAVAGRIPGALNRFHKDNLAADGRFKPAAELLGDFARLGLADATGRPVVHQCGSGVTACHNLLAMTHAGLVGSVLYPGSWSEWSADPARAVARG